jgi:hypothetical protein
LSSDKEVLEKTRVFMEDAQVVSTDGAALALNAIDAT